MRRRRRSRLTALLAVLVPVALLGGIWLGGHPGALPGAARDTLVADSEGRLFEEALDRLDHDYYRRVDRRRLLDRALQAAVESLGDRYSAYFTPRDYAEFREATEGEFEGVGMNVEKAARGLRVLTVFDGSPAERGGLRPGDVITRVNGQSIRGKSSQQATTLIKGPAGTKVTLTVATGRRVRELRLERARVEVPVVESELRTAGGVKVAHVTLASFTSGAHGEVRQAIRALLRRGAKAIVLDLRDNGGGLLNEAVLTASIFIEDGTIVTTDGRARPKRVFEASGSSIDRRIPVVVLVNRESASASEIVAGALQDLRRGTVVGTPTFGKGVFQEIEGLSNGGALEMVVGEYFTPKGRNLGGGGVRRGAGIEPDVRAQDDTATERRDEALEVAVRTVARKAT
jgi:carboxyl-terminal processing protease